jgi:hypothetical protein
MNPNEIVCNMDCLYISWKVFHLIIGFLKIMFYTTRKQKIVDKQKYHLYHHLELANWY